MTDSGYIPKEDLPRFTRWQPDDFSARPQEQSGPADGNFLAPLACPEEAQEAQEAQETQAQDIAGDLVRIKEEARAEGYTAGFEEGREAARAEGYQAGMLQAQARADALFSLAQGLQEALADFDQALAESVLACALEVARQMTQTAFRIAPEHLLPIIRMALAALPLRHEAVVLHVHPEAQALVEEALGGLFGKEGWRIEADAEITPGGCRIMAGHSVVDATLETRWRQVLEAVGLSPEWLERQP